MRSFCSLFLLLSVIPTLNALATIQRAGRYLYNTTDGSRFFIKGVAYQPQGSLPLDSESYHSLVFLGTVGTDAADPFPEPTEFVSSFTSTTLT